MSWRVALIAAILTILAGIAWGLWRAELGSGGAWPGRLSASQADSTEPSEAVRSPEELSSSGRSVAREAARSQSEGTARRPRRERRRRAVPPGATKASTPLMAARRDLRDPSPEVRVAAVRTVVSHGDLAGVRSLTRLARRDPSPEVRAAATEGLRELGAEDAVTDTSQNPAQSEKPVETEEAPRSRPSPGGIDYDSMPMESLVALLSDPHLDARQAAVEALGYNEHYGAIPDLWNAFFHERNWETQDLILDALEDMDQEVEEARELLYMSDEVDIDWDRVANGLP